MNVMDEKIGYYATAARKNDLSFIAMLELRARIMKNLPDNLTLDEFKVQIDRWIGEIKHDVRLHRSAGSR